MKRARGNDGTSMQIERVPRVRQSLLDAIAPPEKFERREPRIFHGPKPYTLRGKNGSWVSDEVILEIRQRHEWHGQSARKIAEAMGLKETTVECALRYTTRLHLEPGPRP